MKTTRTRDEVLDECVNAVVGCWNHYSDYPLVGVYKEWLGLALHRVLPGVIRTTNWQKCAEEQQKYYHEDEE